MPRDIDLASRAHAMLMRVMELDASARRAFVRSECAGDRALMDKLLALIDASDGAEGFLNRPAISGMSAQEKRLPDAVGNYLVLGVLGVGGMATVYEAVQEHPKRRVALKVLNQSMPSSDAYLRFQFETEILARLHHPGIAQIYEAGAAQIGQPAPALFFAMELIPDAVPISEFVEKRALSIRERLAMFAFVCDAVHYGHQHGVIHRDLKPANVLVDGEGHAKVIDFGIARTTEAGAKSLTAVSDMRPMIGTLNYMSPEQCIGSSDIDIRTDVYSLGVLLYEMTCGRLPHELSDIPLPAAVQRIVYEEPQPPRFLNGHIDRDLEAIIQKAIEKQASKRYESAAALAADIRRALNYQAIEARRSGLVDHFRLFARRHRTLVVFAASLVVGILLVAAVSTGFAIRLADEVSRRTLAEQQTARERDVARWEAYAAQIAGALSAMNTGEFEQMRSRLAAAANHPRGWEWGFLSRLAERSENAVLGHEAMILDLAVNNDWSRYATSASDGSIRLWDGKSQSPLAIFQISPASRAMTVSFSPDGTRIYSGDEAGAVRLLDGVDLHEVEVIGRLPGPVQSVAALTGGRVAAAGASGRAKVWTLEPRNERAFPDDQSGGIQGVTVSPDGLQLATYNQAGSVCVRRATDLSVVRCFSFPGGVNQARFSFDGRLIAAAGASGRVFVWSIEDGTLIRDLEATQGSNTVRSIAFSNDGTQIAVGLVHRGIRVFSLADGRLIGDLGGHTDAVSALAFRPDDQMLVSASWDQSIRSWRASEFSSPSGITTLRGHEDQVRAVAFAPDGSVIASASRDGEVRLWDPELASEVAVLPSTDASGGKSALAIDWSRDGKLLAVAGDNGTIRILQTSNGDLAEEFRGPPEDVPSVAFDPAGSRLVAGFEGGVIQVWSIGARVEPLVLRGHNARVNSVRFSPDGSAIASGSRDGTVRLWDARSGTELFCLKDHRSDVFAVLFSWDGKRLFTGSRDQTVKVWDVETGRPVATLAGHGQFVTSLTLSPDGTRLAAGSWFGQIVLFDVAKMDQIASFKAHDAAIRGVAFSPDNRWLASCSVDTTVRLFDSVARSESDVARKSAAALQSVANERVDSILSRSDADPKSALSMLRAAGLDPDRDSWIRKALLHRITLGKPRPKTRPSPS